MTACSHSASAGCGQRWKRLQAFSQRGQWSTASQLKLLPNVTTMGFILKKKSFCLICTHLTAHWGQTMVQNLTELVKNNPTVIFLHLCELVCCVMSSWSTKTDSLHVHHVVCDALYSDLTYKFSWILLSSALCSFEGCGTLSLPLAVLTGFRLFPGGRSGREQVNESNRVHVDSPLWTLYFGEAWKPASLFIYLFASRMEITEAPLHPKCFFFCSVSLRLASARSALAPLSQTTEWRSCRNIFIP